MGLDMYLYTNSKKIAKAAAAASGTDDYETSYNVAIYWRKANAIHKWFVDNVQYEEDDCKIYNVTIEQLKKLREACKKALRHRDRAHEVLPTCEGFFFGGTEYDDWYFDDVERTLKGVNAILENVEQYERETVSGFRWKAWREKGETDDWQVRFSYRSSW